MAPKPLPRDVQPLMTAPHHHKCWQQDRAQRRGQGQTCEGPGRGCLPVVLGGAMPNQEGAWYSCLPRVFPAQSTPPCSLRH